MGLFWWFRIGGTVIVNIWWQVLGFMFYAAAIVGIHYYTSVKLGFGQTLIPVIGAVVSLLMGFRTNSAYSRYWDGRTIWSQMTKNLRQIVLNTWVTVRGSDPKDLIEKKSIINLCVAFAIATKHYLRDEYHYTHDDIKDLVLHLSKEHDNIDILPNVEHPTPKPHIGINIPNSGQEDTGPTKIGGIIRIISSVFSRKDVTRKKGFKLMAYDCATPTNIPLEILTYLLSYVDHVAKERLGENYCVTALNNSVLGLLENLTNFERILRTPIPLAYSIHLHHCVWLYLLAVPFQFVEAQGWGTILVVAFGSFCMLGILSIAYEIEDPFGYDDNDLPLDDFCVVLKREIELITGRPNPVAREWIHSPNNMPFKHSTKCEMNAEELSVKSTHEIHKIMQDNARINYVLQNLRRKVN